MIFLKLLISARGGHCAYFLRSPENFTQLLVGNFSGRTEVNRDKLVVRAVV
jgi:hypothetical protein